MESSERGFKTKLNCAPQAAAGPLELLLAQHPDADDSALIACLERSGLNFELSYCDLPHQVAKLLQTKAFDLIVVDAEFAGRSTLEHFADLLRQPCSERPPLLLLAEAADLDGAQQAISLGAQGFVARDCLSPATLRASVELALSHALQVRAASRQQEMMWRQSMHDGLTGLANRQLLQDRLGQELRLAQRSAREFAVVTLDLDRFGQINENCGQLAGDQVLCEVATRLKDSVRRSDTLSRLGGNQFCALLPAIGGPLQATRLAEKLRRALLRPYRIDGYLADPGVSVGIALFPQHADSTAELMRRSELAMFEAKRRGGGISIYAEVDSAPTAGHNDLERDLERALQGQGQALEIWTRPQLCLDSGACTGAEAFARWQHPNGGVLGAQELCRFAERADLIKPLVQQTLDLTLDYLAERSEPGPSVTLSLPPQLLARPELVDLIGERLTERRMDRTNLLLDFEEAAAIASGGAANPVLRRLTGLGLRISISGVGAALSSFKFLRDFPLAELRVHREFVNRMALQRADARICGTLFHLADCLNLRAVACGVTDARTSRRLQDMGCRFATGPALGREMPLADFDAWRAQLLVLPLARRFSRAPSHAASRSG